MRRSNLHASILRLLFVSMATAAIPSAIVIGCSLDEPSPTLILGQTSAPAERMSAQVDSSEALVRLRELRSVFPANLAKQTESNLRRTPTGRMTNPPGQPVRIELPVRGNEPVRMEKPQLGLCVRFSLDNAASVQFADVDGDVLYRRAAPGRGDIVHRATHGAIEDLIIFDRPPGEPVLRYTLDLDHVSALRLVQNTLEIIDEARAPRIRVRSPFVVDATGKQIPAKLDVEGCDVDCDPRVSFGRSARPPRADQCTLVVRWSSNDLEYPILVDPVWESAGTLTYARSHAAVAEIARPGAQDDRELLITGGYGSDGKALKWAEIYSPISRTFGLVGVPMQASRAAHTATNVAEDGSGKVVIAGGFDNNNDPAKAGTPLNSIEVFDPVAGTFTSTTSMLRYRAEHTTTRIVDGKLLIAGGLATTDPASVAPESSKKAEIFESGVPDIITPVGDMKSPRRAYAALRMDSGKILLTGGFNVAGTAQFNAEWFDPTTSTFAQITATIAAGRARHTMTLLDNGKVLVVGGINVASGVATVHATADLLTYAPTPNDANKFDVLQIEMDASRAGHSATVLPNKNVLLAGGFVATDASIPNPLASASLFDLTTNIFSPMGSMTTARGFHVAALVGAGGSKQGGKGVLVVGGINTGSPTRTNAAEILVRQLGDVCMRNDECLSGHCASKNEAGEGVCCDTACDAVCHSCREGKKVNPGAGVCGYSNPGTPFGWSCVDEGKDVPVEFSLECDGQGKPIPDDGNSCGPRGCDSKHEKCSNECPCSDAGYCVEPPPDAGNSTTPKQCETRKYNGAECDSMYGGHDCQSGNCVDGYCCNTKCEGQCSSCMVSSKEGTCTPVGYYGATQPVNGRPACAGEDMSACKGACEMADFDACTYPKDKNDYSKCYCVNDVCTQTDHICQGDGSSLPNDIACNGFACEGDKVCKTSCSSNQDCTEEAYCNAGKCEALPPDGMCDGQFTVRLPKSPNDLTGEDKPCNEIKCEPGTSSCKTNCKTMLDCAANYVCSLEGKCVVPSSTPAIPSCSCTTRTETNSKSLSSLLLIVFGMVVRRLRRRRNSFVA